MPTIKKRRNLNIFIEQLSINYKTKHNIMFVLRLNLAETWVAHLDEGDSLVSFYRDHYGSLLSGFPMAV